MFRRPATLRRTAWFALLAILLHAFAPFAHGMMLHGTANDLPDWARASICTTPGSPLASLPAQPGPAPDSAPASIDLTQHCPLCLAGAHFALDATPAFRFAGDLTLSHARIALPAALAPRPAESPPFSSRAPPCA